MRVYIAGPMTGYDLYNFPAFDAVRDMLAELGHEPVSPADITRSVWKEAHGVEFDPASMHDGCDYRMFLLADFAEIAKCDAIVLLNGWEHSKGVAAELAFAKCIGVEAVGIETLTRKESECSCSAAKSVNQS